MKVITSFVYPPIPDRTWDWAAWIDGQEESVIGRGPTEYVAIIALLEQLSDEARQKALAQLEFV